MRTTATCPKCSGKKIVVAELRTIVREMGGAADRIPAMAFQVHQYVAKPVGGFESWMCAACGYTEFYAKDLGDVDALAAQWPEDVRIVNSANPAKGPFR